VFDDIPAGPVKPVGPIGPVVALDTSPYAFIKNTFPSESADMAPVPIYTVPDAKYAVRKGFVGEPRSYASPVSGISD
jgi:hypothetical protein